MNITADTTIKYGPHRENVTAPVEHRPAIEQVCPYCSAKHPGPFSACQSCRRDLYRGF